MGGESIDRMYLNAIVPRLQIVEGALRFIWQQRQAKVASTNAVEPLTRNFVKASRQAGWIGSEWGTSENNRRAKYYRLTAVGRKQLAKEQENWDRLTRAVAKCCG